MSSTRRRKTPAGQLTLRCYRHGFGDCFLLSFRSTAKDGNDEAHMLIDCGVLQNTPNEQNAMKKVAQDIFDRTQGRLTIIAAMHEHYDHLCGFLHAKPIFASLNDVKQIWLPWT